MEWNELSMNQRAEVISMAVKAGLRDIDSIRSFYNGQSNSAKSHRFEGGGILSNAQLLDKVNALGHRAYIKNGQLVTSAGTPLVYNYNQDRFEFRNSAGRAYWLADNGQFKTYNKNHNIAATNLAENLRYPATYQTVLEDQAFVLNRSRIDDKKAVPYVEDKEHIIRRGLSKDVPISTNLIDTIKTNLLNNEHQKIALGISSRETNVGHYPSYYVKNPGNSGGISTFKLSGEVNPTDIMNNHQYYISPMRGELNAIYGVPNESPFVYGSPYAYYSMSHFLPFPDSKRKEIENNLKYQRKVGKFDPTKKRTGSNYYNPEDNPWKHAVEYFMDKNYGMGKSYIDKVNKEIPNINYLLNIDTTKNSGIRGYSFGDGGVIDEDHTYGGLSGVPMNEVVITPDRNYTMPRRNDSMIPVDRTEQQKKMMLDNIYKGMTNSAEFIYDALSYLPVDPFPIGAAFKGAKKVIKGIKHLHNAIDDYRYLKAIRNIHPQEVKRLRNKHFLRKSNTKLLDANGMPELQYHTVQEPYDPTFTVFNPAQEQNSSKAIYTTDYLPMSQSYASQPNKLSKAQLEELIQKQERMFKRDLLTNEIAYGPMSEELKEVLYDSHRKTIEALKAGNLDRTKSLYIRTTNPKIIDANHSFWNGIKHLSDRDKDIIKRHTEDLSNNYKLNLEDVEDFIILDDVSNTNLTKDIKNGKISDTAQIELQALREYLFDKATKKTRDIEKLYSNSPYDAVIIDNVIDYGGHANIKDVMSKVGHRVVETYNPFNLKLANPITRDNKGKLIRLSQRDNFLNPDIRYNYGGYLLNGKQLLFNN